MKNTYILLAGIALIAILIVSSKNTNSTHTMQGGMEMSGNEHMMGEMMVSTDKEFLENMIPHHEEAVMTAREVLARGKTTEVKVLAENIISSQNKEIEMMKVWYEDWYGIDYMQTVNYTPMMRELSALSGKALDKLFVEDMIMHHMGAIMMAKQLASFTQRTELLGIGKAIIETQETEVVMMKGWLETILK